MDHISVTADQPVKSVTVVKAPGSDSGTVILKALDEAGNELFIDTASLDGTVGVAHGGTEQIGFSSRGALLTTGNSIKFRNAGIGDASGYSVAITGARGTLAEPVLFGAGYPGTISVVITPQHIGADGYGAVWIATNEFDGQGLYQTDASATTTKFDLFTDTAEELNTTALTNGTRYSLALTIDAAGHGIWSRNGVADGTFDTEAFFPLSVFFSNQFTEAMKASFVSHIAYFPTVLTDVQLLAQHDLQANGATTPTEYADQLIADGATHLWKLDEADPGVIEAVSLPFAFEDSIGTAAITLANLVTMVNSDTVGEALISQGEGVAPIYATDGFTGTITTASLVGKTVTITKGRITGIA